MDYVRPSHPSGAIDRFLMDMRMVPYRCQLCTHRFWVLEWGKEHSDMEFDKRREYQRLGVSFPIFFKGEHVSGQGKVTALSIRGCSIETVTRLQHGTVVALVLHLPGVLVPIDIDSAVVKAALGNRVGLEFLDLDAGEEERLRGHIETLIVTGPGELRKMYLNL